MRELLNDPNMNNYPEFRTFCELKDRGFRKQALAALTPFIETVKDCDFEQRQEFVAWLFTLSEPTRQDDVPDVFVYPLVTNILKPTLVEWTERSSEDARPYRWLGLYAFEELWHERLERAIELGGMAEQRAIEALMTHKISTLKFSFHHINENVYLGEVNRDRATIAEARKLIHHVLNEEKRAGYEIELSYHSELLADWVTYTQSDSGQERFLDWCERNGRDYFITDTFYFEE
ncbi:hypothetical protein [Exiguobacterium sp.]|uniref:hypothetical protein n=1 Tax=Exiguobacterium sp. TaxID=44751 RepID=UPI00263B4920|nr:hypothetical protein [Exiguobacterium sp.]MCC5892074.1 hypothetical protein [Exiguobacterium sp.]